MRNVLFATDFFFAAESADGQPFQGHIPPEAKLRYQSNFTAAGAAEENRPLVAHELAAASGENGRTPDQARSGSQNGNSGLQRRKQRRILCRESFVAPAVIFSHRQ